MAMADRVRDELERVLAHPLFRGADRRARLLRFLVEESLKGQSASLKESVLAMEVFERTGDYDPKIDSAVRVEMGRLRSRLIEYYAQDGRNAPVRIEIPKGSYGAEFSVREPEQSESPAIVPTLRVPHRWGRYAALVIVAVIAIVAAIFFWKRAHDNAAPAIPSLAILPFLNLSGDSAKEYLGDSITDEITEQLAESKGLRVVARTSAFQFKGQGGDVRDIGRRLNVTDLLEGSLQEESGQIRLVVQLIRCADGYHIWSRRYDVPAGELRQVETQIADSAIRTLIPSRQGTAAAEFRTTPNPEAHDLYLRAAYFFHQGNPGELKQAIELSRRAIEIDPSFARAHLLIAKAEQNLAASGELSLRQSWEMTLDSMQKVAALDPDLADVHTYFAYRAYVYEWNWPKARREFELALAAPGSQGNTHNLYGWSLMTRGQFEEARRHFSAGLEIDPMVVGGARQNLAVDWILERDNNRARRILDEMLRINPNSLAADNLLGWIHVIERNCEALQADSRKRPPASRAWELRGNAVMHATCGQREKAQEEMAELRSLGDASRQIPSYTAAEAYATIGDADHAIPLLEKAADQRDSTIMYLTRDPLFDSIRRDVRFKALASRIGLP
jgi:TolB-like protein